MCAFVVQTVFWIEEGNKNGNSKIQAPMTVNLYRKIMGFFFTSKIYNLIDQSVFKV